MSNVWERFSGIANADEVNTAKNSFEPIPAGTYEATLELFEAGENKDGLPKLSGRFRLESGRLAFYNQNLQNLSNPDMTAVNVAEAVRMIGAIKGEDIDFVNLGKLAEDVEATKDCLGNKYKITISYGNKDAEMKFPRFKVLGLVLPEIEEDNEDLPF